MPPAAKVLARHDGSPSSWLPGRIRPSPSTVSPSAVTHAVVGDLVGTSPVLHETSSKTRGCRSLERPDSVRAVVRKLRDG